MKRTAFFRAVLLGAVLFSTRFAAAQELPDLSVQLGATNVENGLAVPAGGDGDNVPVTIEGSAARRISGEKSMYLYVKIAHPAYNAPRDLYVTFEAFDDQFGRATVQYDKASPSPDIQTKYSAAEGAFFFLNTKKWRSATFYLPKARLGHGQNFEADLRLAGKDIAVRRITLSPRAPADFDATGIPNSQVLGSVRIKRAPGMEFTIGDDHINAPVGAFYNALSATSVETYVTWQSVEARKDEWDWSRWDEKVAALQKAKLKWVPFLIAGPAYATPLWFQNSGDSHYYRCLEHNRNSRVQSLFNPALRPQIDRFIKAFAARYREQNVIESLLLGVTGIYGESIYPAGPEGGWTAQLTGDYHNHFGWWAGDEFAQKAFRAALQKRYATVSLLNAAWGTRYASFDEVATFLPEKAPNDRARADFAEWYQDAMTDWSVFWVQTTRKYFPRTAIYLCTGGDGNPLLGADFTAQAKAIAPLGAGIRITNEASDYTQNFVITREVATATRLYDTFCGFEPASAVNPPGVAARVYNATASGARQLHDYAPNSTVTQESIEVLRAAAPYLVPRRPQVSTAVYLSRESWPFEAGRIGRLYDIARRLRDVTDIDFVTRQSVADGVLKNQRALLLCEAPVIEPRSAQSIEQWVTRGGVLVAATRSGETSGARLYDNAAWRERLLAKGEGSAVVLSPSLEKAPPRWLLKVGSVADENWLFGDWHSRERGGEWPKIADATKRWSGARAGIYLPVVPRQNATLRLSLFLPREALPAEIALNGQTLQKLEATGLQELTLRLPAAALTQNLAKLEMRVTTWKPAGKNAGDMRMLGVGVREIELFTDGAENAAPGEAKLKMQLDAAKLRPLIKRVGKGWTIFLPGLAGDEAALSQVLAALWRDTPQYLDGAKPLAPLDGELDNRFVTQTASGALWFDAATARIQETPRR